MTDGALSENSMSRVPTSASVVNAITQQLLAASTSEAYSAYLQANYGYTNPVSLSVSLIYAVEVEGGDLITGAISSVPIQWWMITREGAKEIAPPDMSPFNHQLYLGVLYPHPLLSFFRDGTSVLVSEAVGPLIRRKCLLTLSDSTDRVEIMEQKVLWLLNRS